MIVFDLHKLRFRAGVHTPESISQGVDILYVDARGVKLINHQERSPKINKNAVCWKQVNAM